jgi:hypothetical protein
MALLAKDAQTAMTPAPEGLLQAVCVDAVDLGMKESKRYGKMQHKIRLRWALPDCINPETGKCFYVSKQYTLSLNEKAELTKDLSTWRGRAFTPEEKTGFDVEKLIGINCQVQIMHAVKDNGTYANVEAVVPINKAMTKFRVPDDYVREAVRKATDAQQPGGAATGGDDDAPF